MEEFKTGQRVIIMPDASAYPADDDIIACENYALDYVNHIPISIGNHPFLAEHFLVVETNGKKALRITAEDTLTNELRLPNEPQLVNFTYVAEYMTDCSGTVTVNFNNEPILTLNGGSIMHDGKILAECPQNEFFRLHIAAADKTADIYLNTELIAKGLLLRTDAVTSISESISGTEFYTRGAVCRRGYAIDGEIFPEGVLAVVKSTKSMERGGVPERVKDFKRPDAHEVIAQIKKNYPDNAHNRLYMTDFRRDRILDRIKNGDASAWYESFLAEAESYLDEALPEFCIGDKIRLLPVSRLIKRRLLMYSSAYRLCGDKRYLDACRKLMYRAAEFPHWNDTHFLDTAELCCGFAIAYDALYDALSREEIELFAKTIKEKALVPSLLEYRYGCCRTMNKWSDNDGNWNPVCNAGILIGAIAVLYEYEDIAAEIIEGSLRGIAYNLAELLPDGAWREGPGYWHYNIEFIAYYFDALYTASGSVYGYIDPKGIGGTINYYLAMCGPCGAFNYGDMEPMYVKTPEIYWYASVMNMPQLAALYRRMEKEYGYEQTLWSMLNYEPQWEACRADEIACDMIFRKWWVGSLRSSWNRDGSAYVGFQGGRPNSGHSQMSIGNFVLDINGVRWALDLGYDDYNLDYLDVSENADAWWIYRKSAEGNNCFLINPDDKLPQVYNSTSEIIKFESNEEYSFAEIDLSTAYARQAEYAYRSFRLDKTEKSVTITDRFMPKRKNSEYYWFMHTTADIITDGSTAKLYENGKELAVSVRCGYRAVFLDMDTKPLKSSRHIAVREREAVNEGVRKLALHIDGINGECVVSVKMTEVSNAEN